MKETPTRIITATSSLQELATDQLGNGVLTVDKEGGRRLLPDLTPIQ